MTLYTHVLQPLWLVSNPLFWLKNQVQAVQTVQFWWCFPIFSACVHFAVVFCFWKSPDIHTCSFCARVFHFSVSADVAPFVCRVCIVLKIVFKRKRRFTRATFTKRQCLECFTYSVKNACFIGHRSLGFSVLAAFKIPQRKIKTGSHAHDCRMIQTFLSRLRSAWHNLIRCLTLTHHDTYFWVLPRFAVAKSSTAMNLLSAIILYLPNKHQCDQYKLSTVSVCSR